MRRNVYMVLIYLFYKFKFLQNIKSISKDNIYIIGTAMNEIINKKENKKPPDINPPDNKNDLNNLVDKKIFFFQDIIQKTIIHVQKNKMLDILGISEVNNSIQLLNQISEKMRTL